MQRLALFVLMGSALAGFAQEPAAPLTQIEPLALSEVEQIKGENIRLKLDSLDKQMRLMQEQYARLQEAQQGNAIWMAFPVQQLQVFDEGIVRARALPPAAWRVNWQTGKLERTEPQRHEDTEKNK